MSGSAQKSAARLRKAPPAGQEISALTVTVPGSTANLGPGFDALALALKLYCTLTFKVLTSNDLAVPLVSLKGALSQELPRDQSNLIYSVLANFWRGDPELLQRIRITIESQIPLGKGIGSSAAAVMGAVWAAHALAGDVPDNGRLLLEAAQMEGHADNAAASLLGGLVVTGGNRRQGGVIAQKLPWPKEWCPIVVTPQYVLSTKSSRAVLPRSISRQDAVHNLQKATLLLAAVQNKDEEAMQEALHDKLHEPYREALVPELPAVRKALLQFPVLGTVLSGAGCSVLTIVNQRHKQQVSECLRSWAAGRPQPPAVYELAVDEEGLRVSYE